jgi:kinesin family protein 2/24
MVIKAIETGQANRHIGCTSFNKASSRSHAILQIRLQPPAAPNSARIQSCSNLTNKKKTRSFQALFIDLAGSERGIDAQNNQKDNRKEGAEINQSLLAV